MEHYIYNRGRPFLKYFIIISIFCIGYVISCNMFLLVMNFPFMILSKKKTLNQGRSHVVAWGALAPGPAKKKIPLE